MILVVQGGLEIERGRSAPAPGAGRMPVSLVAHLGEFISVVAPDGTVLATNHDPAADQEQERAAGQDSRTWVHPEDEAVVTEAFGTLVADPWARTRTLVRVRTTHGPYRWMETTGVNRVDDPDVGGLVFVSRDVHDRVRLAQRAERSLQGQRLVAELGTRVLREGSLEPALESALAELARLLGAAAVTLLERESGGDLRVTRQCAERPLPPGHLLPRGAGPAVPELADRGVVAAVEVPLLGSTGDLGLLSAGWTRLPEPEDDSDARQLLQAVANVVAGARSRERRELAALVRALHDPLTGLPTRPLLLDRLDHALARSAREGVGEVAVLLIDLDGFKQVNDRYGHAAGDVLLAQLGGRLARCVRPGDTAARLGGDEFVVLCEDVRDPSSVLDLRDRVREVFDDPFTVPGSDGLVLRGSVGSAFSGSVGHDRAALLHAADLAMYRDKRAGQAPAAS